MINAGISGETSSGALHRVPSVLRLKPDIVVLETGLNDVMTGMDLRITRRNIEEIVRILQKNRVTVVLAGMRKLNDSKRNPAFEEMYPDIAREYNLVLVPFFLANVAGNPALNLYDGIHPTAEGYRRVTRTASTATLTWTAPTTREDGSPLNPAADLSAYKIHYGTATGVYTQTVTVTNPGTATVTQKLTLAPGYTYYFVVTDMDSNGLESGSSMEVWKTL